jgi:hypothetical protein
LIWKAEKIEIFWQQTQNLNDQHQRSIEQTLPKPAKISRSGQEKPNRTLKPSKTKPKKQTAREKRAVYIYN